MRDTKLLRRRFFGKHKGRRIVVECCLHQLGEQSPYFSCTVEFGDGSGGCDHDSARAVWPECDQICKLHLSTDDGVPMHAESSGWYDLAGALDGMGEQYHVGNSERHFPITPPADKPWQDTEYRKPTQDECLQIFADHCRISIKEARRIAEQVKAADNPRAKWAEIMASMLPRWKQEAEAAKAWLGGPDVRAKSYIPPESDPGTLRGFIKANGINCQCDEVDENPHAPEWQDANHWRCLLTMGRHKMTVYFSKGFGHEGAEPTTEEVLRCVLDDSRSAGESFENWAANLGYETDSRKAERTYKTVTKQAEKLRKFLGHYFDDALALSE